MIMDETVKPLRIPPQISVYAEKHEIFDLVQTMVSSLIIDKPEEPISYLISLLRRDRVDVPRIIILGAPASGKTTIAMKLCCQLGMVHVTTDSLLRDAGLQNTHTPQDVPDDAWLRLIQQKLNTPHCFRQGWLLEGIPQSRLQTLSLQENGIIPQHVVILEAPDDVLLERSQGRMLDPVTGDVYHQTFIWPSDQSVAERLEKGRGQSEEKRLVELQRYRREVTGLISAYRQVLKAVNADQPHADVYQQVLNFVLTPGRSAAPITPRILLLGPPGSGKSHQATLLSDKYNMVNVSCGQLLKSVAAADDSRLGGLVKPYIETEQRVPDSLALQILTERLSRLDCCTKGWVLHGFPRDLQQAEKLNQSNYIPSRVFFLEMTDDVAMERLTLRTTDPVSGARYHSVYHPAPPEVQDRLQTSPKDTHEVVRDRLTAYWTNTAPLKSLYVDAVSVNADQEPHSVFESLEGRLLDRRTSSTRVQRS